MYRIEEEDFGYKLTFSGNINLQELESWIDQSEGFLRNRKGEFAVFVDLRNIRPITASELMHFRNGQELYREHGMVRSVVIYKGAIVPLQFRDIAKQSEIFSGERYIDANRNENWEEDGLNWVRYAKEP